MFGKIVWATAIDPVTSAPAEKVTAFAMEAAAIYAVVPVTNVTTGLTVTAEWSFNGTPLPGSTSSVVATQAFANGWMEFHLTLPAGQKWPVGTYSVVLRQPVGDSVHAEVNVELPAS